MPGPLEVVVRITDAEPFAALLGDVAEVCRAIEDGSLYLPSEIQDALVAALVRFKTDAAQGDRR